MSFGQRSIWFQLTAEAIIFVWYGLRFSNRYSAGLFDGPDGLMALGRMTLWFMAGMVVLVIAVHILGLILFAIAEGGKEPDTTMDERDRAIELRGQKSSHAVAGSGIVVGMALVGFWGNVPLMIAAIFLGGLFGEFVGNGVKLTQYARGL